MKKKCSKCKLEKATEEFGNNKSRPDGLAYWCRSCCRSKGRKYYKANKDLIRSKASAHYEINKDQVKERAKKYYHDNIERITEYRNNNKDKESARGKAYREKNKDQIASRAAAHYQENRDHHLAVGKEYSQANKHKRRARENQRRKDDPLFRLNKVIRSRIHKALKNEIKETSSTDLLGCSTKHARQHMESQFTKGMTWENHGVKGWHIDHIIPCDSFDLSDIEQQKQCFHYTNLQPLWYIDNLRKGDKMPDNHQPELAIPA